MSEGLVRDLFAGGDTLAVEIGDKVAKAAAKIDDLVKAMEEAKDTDTARWTALNDERKAEAETLTTLKSEYDKAKREAEHAAAIADTKKLIDGIRTPSKAALLGFGRSVVGTSYAPGTFIQAVYQARSMDSMPEQRIAAKAVLDGIGSRYQTPDEAGSAGTIKATTGLTDATGGWLLPNAIIDDLLKPGRYQSAVSRLVTSRRGLGGVTAVDLPYRLTSPATRAAVIAWGSQKTNEDLTYGGYSATLYTLAKIHDVSKQLLRKSAGAVEADVVDELSRAFAEGEAYYIMQGSGSSQPYGLQPAIAASPGTFTSTTVGAAATLAGSVIKIIADLSGTLAGRNRKPEAAVMSPSGLWLLASQGTENAGFFLDVTTDPTTPTIRVFGIPCYGDTYVTGADDIIVGEWSALKVFYGDGYRVDSSDVANTRWDYNLVGFRGEMEMGLDARPAVYTGAFQFQTDIVP